MLKGEIMADKIITLENLKTFKNKADETYAKKNQIGLGSVPPATSDEVGGIKLGFTSSSNNKAVLIDANNRAYVNIPAATSSAYGLIKTGYTDTASNKGLHTDLNGCGYVSIPVANTTEPGTVKTGYSEDYTNRALKLDSNNRGYVQTPYATASMGGIMRNTDYQHLSTLYDWYNVDRCIVKEGTGHFTSTGMTGLYYQIIGYFNELLKVVKISGSIKVNTANMSEYKMIYPPTFGTALGATGISYANFLKGWWWGTKNPDSATDIYGYGTAMSIQNATYIGFGRIYTTSGSYGDWAQDTFRDGMLGGIVHFEIWFKYNPIK